ncbi:MAG: hypothetical protein QME96_10375 [Myxococcota bacterium]|nr:hypothetical protein [Myxococcota bacterium]
MSGLPGELVAERQCLFHDVTLDSFDPRVHMSFVIERVLEKGTMASVAALVRWCGEQRIRVFLREGGWRRISPRTRALWSAYLMMDERECTRKSSRRINSPFWKP